MEQITEAQIRAKGDEWVQATIASLRARETVMKAELQHKKHRQRILLVEDEMRAMKQSAMALAAHTALA